jgi:formylglycine-generating enzyme required for sulfatase activity
VVRGSAFAYTAEEWSRAAMRGISEPDKRDDTVGIRIVRELTAEEAEFLAAARAK